ncbi:hypothetical protein WHP29_02475 [Campylobacter jejuni]
MALKMPAFFRRILQKGLLDKVFCLIL